MISRQKLFSLFKNPRYLLGAYLLITILVSILQYLKPHMSNGYTPYNNFIIFRNSFYHLIHNGDLYQLWPAEHFDYYKYSPSFPLFMWPFTWIPDLPGLIVWNLLNAIGLFFTVRMLSGIRPDARIFILWFVLIELITSLQNSQSNGLMAALIIGGFAQIERKNLIAGSFLLVLGSYIKIFSVVGFALCLFYPGRWKLMMYTLGWFVLIFLLPLLVIDIEHLRMLYESWFNLLANDHSASTGLSVQGWLQSWFGLHPDKTILALTGMILFLVPFFRVQRWSDSGFRLKALASVLIWVVIFNHKAESPTFIVAIAGVAIWFFSKSNPERSRLDLILLILAFVFASLSATDLFPRSVRINLVVPFVLKAVPCILIWIKIQYEMMFEKPEQLIIHRQNPV